MPHVKFEKKKHCCFSNFNESQPKQHAVYKLRHFYHKLPNSELPNWSKYQIGPRKKSPMQRRTLLHEKPDKYDSKD